MTKAAEPLPRFLIPLLAVACAISVASIYYAQPLAAQMAADLGVGAQAVSHALLATQIGYGLGMILLVPLGDGVERRRLIVTTVAAAVPALLILSASVNVGMLIVSSLFVGIASAVPQMIIPYTIDLVGIEKRGHVVGTLMSLLLVGILLSRTVSGYLALAVGWRGVFVAAAVAMSILAVVLRLTIPAREPEAKLHYFAILRSLWSVWTSQAELRKRALVGALGFASFSAFWSMLSFRLAELGHGSGVAGAMGLIGIVGVLVAPRAARRAVTGNPSHLNATGLLMLAVSFGIFYFVGGSLVWMALGVVLLDAGVQVSHLTNQTVIYGLSPALRSRINALYMVAYFAGGGLGTAIAAASWAKAGWTGVCIAGTASALAGMLPLLTTPRDSAPGAGGASAASS